jgi:hypothetical protein
LAAEDEGYMFWFGLAVSVILSYLGVGFVRRWIERTFGWETEWWFDTLKSVLIPTAALLTAVSYINSQNARKLSEQSLRLANEKIEALNPNKQPILTALCNTYVIIASAENRRDHITGSGGVLAFIKGRNVLLMVSSDQVDVIQQGNDRLSYASDFTLLNPLTDQSISSLHDTDLIAIRFNGIKW